MFDVQYDLKNISIEFLFKIFENNQYMQIDEETWECILEKVDFELPNVVFDYLIDNELAIMSLCHMSLLDEQLKRLVSFDDAPLYTLAKRYVTLDKYTDYDFISFYNEYLSFNDVLCIHLLDIYNNSSKRNLLISLCDENDNFIYKDVIQEYKISNMMRGETSSEMISKIYSEYKQSSIVLLAIAGNLNTPYSILEELSLISGIKNAKSIRNLCLNTIKQLQKITE